VETLCTIIFVKFENIFLKNKAFLHCQNYKNRYFFNIAKNLANFRMTAPIPVVGVLRRVRRLPLVGHVQGSILLTPFPP
jgi:hypothetical protein